MAEWITGVVLITIIMAANVWLAWWIGRYEMTGARGWRRIPAGLWLARDTWSLWIHRWIARHERDSGDRS